MRAASDRSQINNLEAKKPSSQEFKNFATLFMQDASL